MNSRPPDRADTERRLPATLGHPRLHLRETDSTNERARQLALAGAPTGALVTASFQTAGRGRQGRRWTAPAGSALLMSLILRDSPDRLTLLPLAAAVAVCEIAGPRAQIKWPNDVVVANRPESRSATPAPEPAGARPEPDAPELAKLAGILTEARLQEGWAVLGIGLNVAVRLEDLPDDLPLTAATLGQTPEMIEPTLARLLSVLQRQLAEPAPRTLDAWRARDALHGREIEWGSCVLTEATSSAALPRERGRAEGIDDAGRLLVAVAGGRHTSLDAGEVRLVRVEDR